MSVVLSLLGSSFWISGKVHSETPLRKPICARRSVSMANKKGPKFTDGVVTSTRSQTGPMARRSTRLHFGFLLLLWLVLWGGGPCEARTPFLPWAKLCRLHDTVSLEPAAGALGYPVRSYSSPCTVSFGHRYQNDTLYLTVFRMYVETCLLWQKLCFLIGGPSPPTEIQRAGLSNRSCEANWEWLERSARQFACRIVIWE